jgi:hypothetical protein
MRPQLTYRSTRSYRFITGFVKRMSLGETSELLYSLALLYSLGYGARGIADASPHASGMIIHWSRPRFCTFNVFLGTMSL